jgi:hypothetical protein
LIIDDYRLFGKGPSSTQGEDWSDITEEKITAMAQRSFCKRMGIEFIDIIVINNSIRK